jgi:hypothetical protein
VCTSVHVYFFVCVCVRICMCDLWVQLCVHAFIFSSKVSPQHHYGYRNTAARQLCTTMYTKIKEVLVIICFEEVVYWLPTCIFFLLSLNVLVSVCACGYPLFSFSITVRVRPPVCTLLATVLIFYVCKTVLTVRAQ